MSSALQYIRCRSEVPCLAPRVLFFLITQPGIDKTSLLFLSNSLVLCDGYQTSSTGVMKQCRSPSINYNRGIVFWKRLRKVRRSQCCSCRRSATNFCDFSLNLLIFSVWFKSLQERFLTPVAFELLNQRFDFVFASCVLLFDLTFSSGHAGIVSSFFHSLSTAAFAPEFSSLEASE